MARKKKQKEVKITPLQSNQPGITVHATQQFNSVAYQGKVTVKVMKGKECRFSAVYHNAGRWPLFYFISLCLIGQYSEADDFRPKYIDLYNLEETEVPVIDDTTSKERMQGIFGHKVTTNTYPYMSLPEPKKVAANGIGSSSLTYKFNIPFTQLQTDGTGQIEQVNLVALYANTNKAEQWNPSAYFFVTEADKRTLKNLLSTAGSDVSAYRNEYSLYIEWELCVSNPSRPTN